MSVAEIGDDEDKQDEFLKGCSVQELDGMYLNAARQGDWPRIERLLAAGAELDYAGGGALTAAIDGGHIDTAKRLLARGLNPERSKQEALNDAVFAGRADAVRFLIDEVRADPNFQDATPLYTAVVNDRPGVAQVLLDKGADVHAHKDTLLCISLSHKFEAVAAVLMENGADPRKRFLDKNAYEWAAEQKLPRITRRLRVAGDTDVYMSPGFFRRQTLEELRGLYDDHQKDTGLYLAALAGCFDIVRDKILAAPGARLSADELTERTSDGKSVLAALAETGQLEIAFDARLWAGRKDEALKALSTLDEAARGSIDTAALCAEIDQAALKARARGLKLKPK